jgi:hypothetical protein
MLVSSFENKLLELLLSQFIYLLFILNKGKKDIVFQNGQKYFSIASSLRKHQSTTMLLFKLAVFCCFLAALQVQTHCQKHTYCRKAHPHFEGQVSLLFWANSPSQNNRKIHKNFSNQAFKMCGRKLSDTSHADFIKKKSLKLFARVKNVRTSHERACACAQSTE